MTTIHLKHPLVLRTKEGEVVQTIDNVVMSPLKTGQMLAALDEAGSKQGSLMRALIFYATRLAREDIDRLHLEDFMLITGELQHFLPSGLKTGGMGSSLSQALLGSPQDGSDGDQQN